jgi:hypothetical protein
VYFAFGVDCWCALKRLSEWERGVGFEFVLGHQNMQNKVNEVLFAEHVEHEKSNSTLQCRTAQGRKLP